MTSDCFLNIFIEEGKKRKTFQIVPKITVIQNGHPDYK